MNQITREQALALLQKYNQESFHILHALTVEGVMRYYAETLGYGDEVDFWGLCGLLHDIDFEKYPEAHCIKAPELLAEIGAPEAMVHAVCSHAYGLCSDVAPEHELEKVMFAVDELTGLIGAAARMRPSGDVHAHCRLPDDGHDGKRAAECHASVQRDVLLCVGGHRPCGNKG